MKFTLALCGLAALAAATPSALFERAGTCTNGVQDPDNGPCSYTVSCNTEGVTTATPLDTVKGVSWATCLDDCQNYAQANDANCYSVDYAKKTRTCTLYSAQTFSSSKKSKGFNSAVVNGCG